MAFCGCHCGTSARPVAAPLEYDDLAPLLDAGYIASLAEDDFETTHFSVVKTGLECARFGTMLHDFLARWKTAFPGVVPTLTVIGAKPGRRRHSAHAMEAMVEKAKSAGMHAYSMHFGGRTQAFADRGEAEPVMPQIYSPVGIVGVARPAKTPRSRYDDTRQDFLTCDEELDYSI